MSDTSGVPSSPEAPGPSESPEASQAHEAGRSDPRGAYSYENAEEVELDATYVERLAGSPAALAFFESQAPSYRRTVKRWVMSAKRQETRDRRMAQLVEDCEAGLLVKPLRYGRNNSRS